MKKPQREVRTQEIFVNLQHGGSFQGPSHLAVKIGVEHSDLLLGSCGQGIPGPTKIQSRVSLKSCWRTTKFTGLTV